MSPTLLLWPMVIHALVTTLLYIPMNRARRRAVAELAPVRVEECGELGGRAVLVGEVTGQVQQQPEEGEEVEGREHDRIVTADGGLKPSGESVNWQGQVEFPTPLEFRSSPPDPQ